MKKRSCTTDFDLEAHSETIIRNHLKKRPRAGTMWDLITGDPDIVTGWQMANFVAAKKLGMNDHGRTHVTVATASALTLLDLLEGSSFVPDIVAGGFGDRDDAALVVMTAMLFHDLGNMVHREDHADLSVVLAQPILDRLLPRIYDDPQKRTAIRSFILLCHLLAPRHSKAAHGRGGHCLYRGFDRYDQGRGRVAFESGSITIHSVSALLDRTGGDPEREGKTHRTRHPHVEPLPGIFQVQEILAPKVLAGPLAGAVDVIAVTDGSNGETKEIISGIRMAGRKVRAVRQKRHKHPVPGRRK